MSEPVVGTPEPDDSGYGTRQEMRKEIVALRSALGEAKRKARAQFRRANLILEKHDELEAALDSMREERDALAHWRNEWMGSDAARALEQAEAQLAALREAAKTAKSLAAAPDYDGESIKEALWAVVRATEATDA